MIDTDPELLDGYVPPPYRPPATLDERLVKAWREVTRTPGRAALATVDLCALIGIVLSLRTVSVTTADSVGFLRARCGISFYLGGARNQAVDTACRYAYGSRIPELVLLGVVILAATGLLVWSIVRPTPGKGAQWSALVATPGRAALAVLDLALLMTAIVALQPVTVTTSDPTSLLNARCGLQYFVFAASNSSVAHACRRAYGPRAALFFIAVAGLIVGVVVLARWSGIRRSAAPPGSG
jgi:hypothetical protein